MLTLANDHLLGLAGDVFDVLTVHKPASIEEGMFLSRIVSKLSPIIGNLIEYRTVSYLNEHDGFAGKGVWKRQDPGFPDAIFDSALNPQPGYEIKAWFPLATEITARFKDSQNAFAEDHINVVLLAWLPEHVLFGRPVIVDVCIVSGKSVALARDTHYHRPPDYIVLEPEDTSARTANLQQTNTNGYKWQGDEAQLIQARAVVSGWGADGIRYVPAPEYQARLKELQSRFPYRLDTNFAKMDRIEHAGIEEFKERVLSHRFGRRTIQEWNTMSQAKDDGIRRQFVRSLGV